MTKNSKLFFLACGCSLVFCLPIQANFLNAQESTQEQPCTPVTPEQTNICETAKKITVKIVSQDDPTYKASGILINKEERQDKGQTIYLYLVLTNDHVIQGLKKKGKSYSLKTFDGNTYQTHLYPKKINWDKNDLGLLYFFSKTDYETAKLGESTKLQDGEDIFVSGFPNDPDNGYSDKFNFISGKANTLIINKKPLESGYQLGFDNNTRNGMSGGPVLNKEGLLVGINGRGDKQPNLFRSGNEDVSDVNPYAYKDGTEPEPAIIERFKELAWAIPIETYIKYTPKLPFEEIPTKSEKKISSSEKISLEDKIPGDIGKNSQNNRRELLSNSLNIVLILFSHSLLFILGLFIGKSRFSVQLLDDKSKHHILNVIIDQSTGEITIQDSKETSIIVLTPQNKESYNKIDLKDFGLIKLRGIYYIYKSGEITLNVDKNNNKISFQRIKVENNLYYYTVYSHLDINQSNQLGTLKLIFTTEP